MRALTLLLAALLAAGGAAAPKPPDAKVQLEYGDRLLAMDDTADAHAALARWCEEKDLEERAELHWREALVRDADHPAARAALGFVRTDDGWVPAAEAPRTELRKDAAEADPTLADRRAEIAGRLRQVKRTLLLPHRKDRWAKGRLEVLTLRDPAAVEPIVRIVGDGGEALRILTCEALAGIPGDEATRYLLGYLLADPSEAVVSTALQALAPRTDPRIESQLTYAVARGRQRTAERAARALGRFGSPSSVPALIANLLGIDYERVTTREIHYPPPVRGSAIAFVAGVRPVVGPGVVAYDPIIGYVTPGGIRIPQYEYPYEVEVTRNVPRTVPRPEVLAALKRITGEDFAYDRAAWRQWFVGR